MTALYFKDVDGVLKPVPLSDAGALSVNALTSVDRASVHPAGSPFDVPAYTVGADDLQVFYNGLLLVAGSDYTEASGTTITFSFDLPTDAEVTAVSTTSANGAVSSSISTSENRAGVLTAGTPFTVQSHAVGSDLIKVYLNGLLCQEGVHFQEVSATAIIFTSDIAADVQITTVVTVVS